VNSVHPQRIVMVIQSYLPRLGGAEKQLSAVCVALRQNGVDPVVVTRQYKGMPRYEVINGTPVYRVPAPLPKPLAAFCFIVFGFIKILQLKPDVIHAYELLSPSDLAIISKNWLKQPLIVKVLRGGWMGDVYKLHHSKSTWTRIARLKKYVDMFITISREIEIELIAEGIDEQRCRFIPNGVDISIYKPVSSAEKKELRNHLGLPQNFLVLYCGRLAPEKGLEWLLSAWNQFKHKGKANLILIGSGEEEEKLKKMADESVIFRSFIPDPLQYYQVANALVLPSNTEGLSNSMLEAMACGLPVIAARVGAAPEVITHRQTGFLVSPGNSPELLNALEIIYENQALSNEIGNNGIEVVRYNYPLEKTVKALLSLYSELSYKKGDQ
jgi:glycosyltransferase involved in cell wall biosynthesis